VGAGVGRTGGLAVAGGFLVGVGAGRGGAVGGFPPAFGGFRVGAGAAVLPALGGFLVGGAAGACCATIDAGGELIAETGETAVAAKAIIKSTDVRRSLRMWTSFPITCLFRRSLPRAYPFIAAMLVPQRARCTFRAQPTASITPSRNLAHHANRAFERRRQDKKRNDIAARGFQMIEDGFKVLDVGYNCASNERHVSGDAVTLDDLRPLGRTFRKALVWADRPREDEGR
jgi:hypothetical protein